MSGLLTILALGLATGAIYAMVTVGYSLIYSVLGFINFAHGDLLAVGAYAVLALTSGPLRLPLPLAIVLAAALSGTVALALGQALLVPARRRSAMLAFVTAIAASILLQNLIGLIFSYEARPFLPRSIQGPEAVLGLPIRRSQIWTMLASGGLLLGIWFGFLKGTDLGLEVRACASNPRAGFLMGLRRGRVFGVAFFLSGLLAGLAGLAVALDDRILVPTMGFSLGLRAFLASVLGGITSLRGAVAGAFLLGLAENLILYGLFTIPGLLPLASLVSKDAVALAMMGLVLAWRPQGLFGAGFEARP